MLKCLFVKARRRLSKSSGLFVATSIFVLTAVSSNAQAQGWNLDALESAYDDFSDYLSEMGKFSDEDWRVRVGAAIGTTPDFSGSDRYEIRALPVFQIRYKDDVWIDPLGVRVKVWSNECCRILAQAGISTGRNPRVDSKAFRLPDISTGADVGFTFEGRVARFVAFRLRARHEVAGGHGGVGLSAAVGTIIRTGPFEFIPEIATEWKNGTYMNAYYGVPLSATAATGYNAYSPGAGFEEAAVRLTSFYDLSEKWQLVVRGEAKLLLSEAKNAPFVEQDGDDFQGLFGMGILYTF
ncbi:MAG: MipA/OmpV family protein [Rhodospirillaceae bacterium]